MSHLISKSFRAFATIGRQSRLQNAQRATCRLFSDKSDEVKPPAAENQAAVAENVADKKTLGGFAKAFEKYTRPAEEPEPVVENRSFAQLLRESKFVDVSSIDAISNHFPSINHAFFLAAGRPEGENRLGQNRPNSGRRLVH